MPPRTDAATPPAAPPAISFVMPCYNEEESVEVTIRRLFAAFDEAGVPLELVAVDNGSADRTGEILGRLSARDPRVRVVRVELNQGYGNGILTGLPHARARWVGIVPADGQVDAEDVVRLWDAVSAARADVVAKVRRRFRMDGAQRRVVSVAYNGLMQLLWPGLGTLDVNGTPKILSREALAAMRLSERGWFLDPEIMIKAHYLGLRVLELNVFARMRGNGVSHVRAGTCWDFVRGIAAYRFSREIGAWRRDARQVAVSSP